LPLTLATLIAFEWKQRHESRSLDRFSNGVLTDRCATSLSPTDNFAMTVD